MQMLVINNKRLEGKIVKIVTTCEGGWVLCLTPEFEKVRIRAEDLLPLPEKPRPAKTITHFSADNVLLDSKFSYGVCDSSNMKAARNEVGTTGALKPDIIPRGVLLSCEKCGIMYDEAERLGLPGKLTHCPDCASKKDVKKYTGNMIYSHKTAPEIEIKQGDTLVRGAEGLIKRRE